MNELSPATRYWPHVMKRIARVVGEAATLRLVAHCGGLDRSWVPVHPRPDHPWAQVLGFEALRALSEAMGGERVYVPRGTFRNLKKAQIIDLMDQGLSARAVALELGCTERWVQVVRAEIAATDQGGLF